VHCGYIGDRMSQPTCDLVSASSSTLFAHILSIYEFIQRRSDWKKIEKTVDKVCDSMRVPRDGTDYG
jgi:hypothetical protein